MPTRTPDQRVSAARKRLLTERPFYGSLGMRLSVEISSDGCDTAQTDGTRLTFNPDFVSTLSDAELLGVMAHEVLHCSLRHPYRIGSRDQKQFNVAADYVINLVLSAEGFTLPDGALLDSQYSGMSAEQVYALLGNKPSQTGQPQSGNGQGNQSGQPDASGQPTNASGQGQPSPTGSFSPAPSPDASTAANGAANGTPDPMSEHDWEIATEQASMIAAKAGKLGSDTARAIKTSRESIDDWRAILRDFVTNTVPTDYSFTRPNKRHVCHGLYLPGLVKENAPRFTVAVDTSGSMSERVLALISAELSTIMSDVQPDGLDVIYCDATINGTDIFEADEPVTLRCIGGGGTAFSPVFTHIASADTPPACLIYFTDLESSDTPPEPDYPVLWITSESTRLIGPFGQTIRLSQWD